MLHGTVLSCPSTDISDRHMSPWSCWHTKGRGRRGLMMSLRGALHHWWINVLESDASWLFFKSAQQRWPLLVLLCVWVKTFACRESQSCVVVSLELWGGFQHWTSLCFRWHYWTTRCCLGRLFFPSPFKWKKMWEKNTSIPLIHYLKSMVFCSNTVYPGPSCSL